ncbi:MAG: 4-hydroxy-tetrahydrodipicolinate reductase [Lentisphaeria bacterium]
MTKIAVVGAAGRMGRMIIQQIAADPEATLVAAIENADSDQLGIDAGTTAGIAPVDVPITAELGPAVQKADAMIDFSAPECTLPNARSSVEADCGVVIGTTGFSDEDREALKALPKHSGKIVLAPNMSVGVNILFDLCCKLGKVLCDDYDMEVVEMHHNQKKDAPSGTARKLAEVLAESAGLDYDKDVQHGREGMTGARPRAEIGMHALRGGDVVGDHTVVFAGEGERIELTHKASSRSTFAKGAVRAAKFLDDSPAGLYDMLDVLGIR